MTVAAVLMLNGVDPVGVPWLAATDQTVRDVWMAIVNRAAELSK